MKKLHAAVFGLLFLMLASGDTQAQQTIFNVPSGDVLDKGKVYLELDALFKVDNDRDVRRFSSLIPRAVVGVGGDVEVGVNVLGNIQPGADSTIISPNVKWRPYNGKDNGVQVVVGSNLFLPVRNKTYNIGNYTYAQVSKTFKSNTRLTGGGYVFTKNVVAPKARGGAQFGFEQPINSKFSVVADYITGKHAAGYFTPGIFYKPHPKVVIAPGYSIGNLNPGGGNNFFFVFLGINVN